MKIMAILLTTAVLSACGTVSGLGKDLQGASEWTQKKISPTQLNGDAK
jgi:predicted small secreted protein